MAAYVVRTHVLACDQADCSERIEGEDGYAARRRAVELGWALRGGHYCPAHYPLKECNFCGRPMRPWGKRPNDPGMAGSVPIGSGGLCQTCTRQHGTYERMLDRAVERYYSTRAAMQELRDQLATR